MNRKERQKLKIILQPGFWDLVTTYWDFKTGKRVKTPKLKW